jgi:hypothetical protein
VNEEEHALRSPSVMTEPFSIEKKLFGEVRLLFDVLLF